MGLDMFFSKAEKILNSEMKEYNSYCQKLTHYNNVAMYLQQQGKTLNEAITSITNNELEDVIDITINDNKVELTEEDYEETDKVIKKLLSQHFNMEVVKKVSRIIDNSEDTQYFRKHPNLHGYLTEKYSDQMNNEDNCTHCVIDKQELENIKELAHKALHNEDVKSYSGFFWGNSLKSDWLETIDFVDNVLPDFDDDKHSMLYYAWY